MIYAALTIGTNTDRLLHPPEMQLQMQVELDYQV